MKRAEEILLLTIDTVPWKLEILGLAAGTTYDVNMVLPGHSAALGKALAAIQQSAAKFCADAVIGLRLTSAPGHADELWVAATGTAIRWLIDQGTRQATSVAVTPKRSGQA